MEKTVKMALALKEAYPVAMKARQDEVDRALARTEAHRKYLAENSAMILDVTGIDVAHEQSKPFVDYLAMDEEEGGSKQFLAAIQSSTKYAAAKEQETRELKVALAQAQGKLAEFERSAKRTARVPEVPLAARKSHIQAAQDVKGDTAAAAAQVAQSQADVKTLKAPYMAQSSPTSMHFFKGGVPRPITQTNAPVAALKQVTVQQNDAAGDSAPQTGDAVAPSGSDPAASRLQMLGRCMREDGFYLPSGRKVDLGITGRNMSAKSWRYLQEQVAFESDSVPTSYSIPAPVSGAAKRTRDG
jgi:hypothetical protein